MKRELLNAYMFYSSSEAGELCSRWRGDYDSARPHKVQGYFSTVAYGLKYE